MEKNAKQAAIDRAKAVGSNLLKDVFRFEKKLCFRKLNLPHLSLLPVGVIR